MERILKVLCIVNELDKNDAPFIEILENLLNDGRLKNDLAFISANLNFFL